jgi:hypothetical protein
MLSAAIKARMGYLMSQADVAMYRDKHAGKGGYFFIEEVGALVSERGALPEAAAAEAGAPPQSQAG